MKKSLLVCALAVASASLVAQEKVMVAYFSATGTTRTVAEQLAKEKNAFLWEIEPYEPYTEADLDWHNKQSRSSLEMADPEERPTIRICTDTRPYDVVYLGFPIWWGVAPRIINSWLDNCDMTGKKVIPFATSGSSGIEKAVDELRHTYPQYTFEDGILMNNRK